MKKFTWESVKAGFSFVSRLVKGKTVWDNVAYLKPGDMFVPGYGKDPNNPEHALEHNINPKNICYVIGNVPKGNRKRLVWTDEEMMGTLYYWHPSDRRFMTYEYKPDIVAIYVKP